MKHLNEIAGITFRVFAIWTLALPFPASAQRMGCFDAELVKLEADYIVNCQYWSDDRNDCAFGAINNIYDAAGNLDWVVPRENALAILGLVRASQSLGEAKYVERAQKAMDYLLRMQDSDGGWFNQYKRCQPSSEDEGKRKSPTQTTEVMIALDQLGYQQSRYQAMVKAAEFLLTLQDPANKTGLDDGLMGGGIDPTHPSCTPYCKWRWTHDNAFAYQALNAAALWAGKTSDTARQQRYEVAANRVLDGIDKYLKDPDSAAWHVAVDEQGRPACLAGLNQGGKPDYKICELVPVQQRFYEWINYAPQMLDVPAKGVGKTEVGTWIHDTLVDRRTGAAAWDNRPHSNRLSPGYSFQASLVWLDLDQRNYHDAAWNWANASGLHQKTPDPNGVRGGWIDWTERSDSKGECVWNPNPIGLPPCWERFIDTSFYAIASTTGGFDFSSAVKAYQESPSQDSHESGIGLIRGWVCNAKKVEVEIDRGERWLTAYGTKRGDTTQVCGDTHNGYGLTFNWNQLGNGTHTLRAFADGKEFSNVTFNVTTLGVDFLRGASGEYPLPNFPQTGENVTVRWSEPHQNFVIVGASRNPTSTQPATTTPLAASPARLESPQQGSFESGIGLIRGWICQACTVEIQIDGGERQRVAYGTTRNDTDKVCGDANNGFGYTVNWNNLGNGTHTLQAFADGAEFANVTFTVTTLDVEFLQGASGEYPLLNFPQAGENVTVRWSEPHQNFVIVGFGK